MIWGWVGGETTLQGALGLPRLSAGTGGASPRGWWAASGGVSLPLRSKIKEEGQFWPKQWGSLLGEIHLIITVTIKIVN